MAKPSGKKRGQQKQPDGNILRLLERYGGTINGDARQIVNMLWRQNKPTDQHQVQAAIERLLKQGLVQVTASTKGSQLVRK